MNELNPTLHTILSWVVTLIVPVFLLLTAVRILLTPLFVQIEYRLPGFPEDTYGFTQQDRLKWAPVALNYLLNDADVTYLGDLTFEDGSPLYNERELSHMVDVKVLVQKALRVWLGTLLVLGGLGIWAWRAGWLKQYGLMLSGGGKFTFVLIFGLAFYIGINFQQLFVNFHRIFFQGDSWLFLYSDTLIRLFPIRFWRDAFVLLAGLTFLGAGSFWYFFEYRLLKK